MKNEIELKLGKLYDCSIECNGKIIPHSIIPLAKDDKSKEQYILFEARKLFNQNPKYIKDIIDMSFNYIMNDGIRSNYPFEYYSMATVCSQSRDGSLLDNNGNHIFGFEETNIL